MGRTVCGRGFVSRLMVVVVVLVGGGGAVRAPGRLAADWTAGLVPSPNKIDGSGVGHAGAAIPPAS